jgi:hypothetical protein
MGLRACGNVGTFSQHASRQQYVQDTKAGDGAAQGWIQHYGNQLGIFIEKVVMLPEAQPRQQDQEDTQEKKVQADEHSEEDSHSGAC